ncbi:MAG: ribonuclease activity regulator RraA [Chloroflexi bacterium]|nr:ribonuclease activity regulator RraA [Chloroflexota bacterium]
MSDGREPLSEETRRQLLKVSVATLSSQLLKRGFRQLVLAGVKPLRPDLRLIGQAFTLRYLPSREDVERGDYDNTTNKQRIAVESVGPGDVLVIDARGNTVAGTLGNILATRMKVRGVAGIVTDGAFRDSAGIRAIDLPTYAAGAHPNVSSTVHYPVDMNLPIACGGVAIFPGDVIVGDAEAVIVVPRKVAGEVARDAFEQEEREQFILHKIEAGSSIIGVYPPDEQTLAEFRAWKSHRLEAGQSYATGEGQQ